MSRLVDKFEKNLDNFLEAKIRCSNCFAIASFALAIGISLGKNRWMPDSREISGYVGQGIQLVQRIYQVPGGNEVLNPVYQAPNTQF